MRTLALRRCAGRLRQNPPPGNVLRLRGSVGPCRAGGTGRGGSDPPRRGLGTGSGAGVFAHPCPRPLGVATAASIPTGKVEPTMKLGTLVIIGAAVGAALGRAIGAPFPGVGDNPYLDLIAHHDPGIHTAIRVWYHAAPAAAVILAGNLCLSVWRVWFQPLVRIVRRGKLPAWPTSPKDDSPSLVVGELHHPTVARPSERPSWLVIPEKGLYTGVLVVGAVGTGKTTACMYPFAEQLLSWRADDPGRRAGALVVGHGPEARRAGTQARQGLALAEAEVRDRPHGPAAEGALRTRRLEDGQDGPTLLPASRRGTTQEGAGRPPPGAHLKSQVAGTNRRESDPAAHATTTTTIRCETVARCRAGKARREGNSRAIRPRSNAERSLGEVECILYLT